MASSGAFKFPPFHAFPPSYTRQPVPSTCAKQTQLWCDLIREYCKVHRIFWLDVAAAEESSLFRNDSIDRRLSSADILFYLGELVNRGDGEWDANKTHCLVYWRRPSEWGEHIFQWVQRTARSGQVLTVREIRNGLKSESSGTCFVCSILG